MKADRPPPAVAIVLELERGPYVRFRADTAEDEARIRFWINSRPELLELVTRAVEIAEQERAA